MKPLLNAFLVIIAGVAPALAQERMPLGTHVGNAAQTSGYDDGGRRDPFVSLMTPKKAAPAAPSSRPRAGLAGLTLADVAVKGIVHSGPAVVAVLEGPEGRSFIARSKDRLQDAVVKSIDADGVVFVEQAVDAAGAVHSRDVRKTLRSSAEGIR
jgi:Tfp pilus assembly protein PilP